MVRKHAEVRRGRVSEHRRVLLFPASMDALEPQFPRLVSGVARYARPDLPWEVVPVLRPVLPGALGEHLRDVDGAFLAVKDDATLEAIETSSTPVVDYSQEQRAARAGLPRVTLDNLAVGQVGARHLLDRGLKHLRFLARRSEEADQRWEGFRDTAAAAGADVALLDPARAASSPISEDDTAKAADRSLTRLLGASPRPIGVMAARDIEAMQVLRACHRAGLDVPSQVAVLGVHDDEALCQLALPQLSSIRTPMERLGYEAAAMLHRLMEGEGAGEPVVLQPLHVVERQSTSVLAVEDRDLREVLMLIRERFTDPEVEVGGLLDQVPVGRRTLELRCRKALGRTPGEELRRLRIERAKRLLSTTAEAISTVAFRSGYASLVRLAEAFRREVQMTPTAYRNRHRQSSGSPEPPVQVVVR